MNKKAFRIGVITSSLSLAHEVAGIVHSSEDIIHVSSKGLDKAIPAGRKMERDGVEVIISRKGTAHLLRENLKIPIISVPLSALDILSCISEAVHYGKKILLPSFRTRTNGLEIIEKFLSVELMQGVYEDRSSLRELIHLAKNKGCQVVAGGGLGSRFAQECGIKGIEIKTSEEVINTSLESARSVALAQRQDKEMTELYRCILDSVSEGIIAVDQKGRITTANKQARELLKIEKQDIAGDPIHHFIPDTSLFQALKNQIPIYDNLERVDKKLYIFNHIPVMMGNGIVGGVSTFSDTTKIVQTENKVRRNATQGLKAKYLLKDLKYRSKEMQRLIQTATLYAATDSTLLICGETGTGKELLTQGIHNLSKRRQEPFVSINCAALPEQLLESELFGYEEGAFTGSKKGGKPGQFEIAHKGTILLDEISSTSETVQTRLLRVLQEREVMRIGGSHLIPIDVRVIANTNKDLVEEAQAGRFREDLFFRLNILQITIIPLRQRQDDIPLLAQEFIRKNSIRYHLRPIVTPEIVNEALMKYAWPGNVRQLQHFIERLVLLCNGSFSNRIFQEIYSELIRYCPRHNPDNSGNQTERGLSTDSQPLIDPIKKKRETTAFFLKERMSKINLESEVDIIRNALKKAHYNRGKTAKLLAISRSTLWKKMKAFGL